MSYQVLARKWRPKNFTEISGQQHVVRVLQNALTQARLHHAYLFAGTRGVGKTTIARILAKCLNCETGITANPCGKCSACNEIDAGAFLDLIEVDAASRTKVEDTRDLLDNVQYLPTKGRYKIYIIDEVHMLSGHSFNALLKTLEEPPDHVKFLLATTDPQKLPVTVLSRCLQFNLKALAPELIQKQLQHILAEEKVIFEEPALNLLALEAKGSVRDALSLLDQAIAFGQKTVLTTDVQAMLGTIDMDQVLELVTALVANDPDKILEIIAKLAELAVDFKATLDKILEILHQISLLQLVPNMCPANWPNSALVTDLATRISPEDTQLYYQIAIIGKRDIDLAPTLRAGFEMIVLRMLAFVPAAKPHANTDNIIKPGDRKITISSTNNGNDSGQSVLQKLAVTGLTRALLQHCVITKNNGSEIELLLDPGQGPLLSKQQKGYISDAFGKYYNSTVSVDIKIGHKDMGTPAAMEVQKQQQREEQARQAIEKDTNIQELIDKFGAKVVATSAKKEENGGVC